MKHLALVLLAAGSASCGLGSLPTSVMELSRRAAPDGSLELSIDQGGAIREVSAGVKITEVPGVAMAAVLAAAGNVAVVGAEREIRSGGRYWEVVVRKQGRDVEYLVDGDGEIVEVEEPIDAGTAPKAVLAAADAAMPDGELTGVERVTRADCERFHVKKTHRGTRYKLIVGSEGRVLRVLRVLPAALELPR